METRDLKTKLNFLGDLIDHLNLSIEKNLEVFSEEEKKSFQSVIDYYNTEYDKIDNHITELNNIENPSWMELYKEEKHLRLTA